MTWHEGKSYTYQNLDYIFMVNECKICVHTGSYDYQFCAEKVKNNMNTNYIQGVTEMQVKNWTMPIKTKNKTFYKNDKKRLTA